jgi:PAS domain S-box-containing protein
MKQNDKSRPPEPGLRAAAEIELANNPVVGEPGLSTENLLHELHVHQIQLEMQNETLRQAHSALEESRDRYVDLYDFAPIGYITLNSNGIIETLNLTAATLLGAVRKDLLQRPFVSQLLADSHDRWPELLLLMLKQDSKHSVKEYMQRRDGTVFPALLDCVPQKVSTGGTELRIALTDITEQERAETELHASHDRVKASHAELERRVTERTAQLHKLAINASISEENERHAIARDLHDNLGQILHVARIKIDALAKKLPDAEAKDLGDLRELVGGASRLVRSLTSQLSPPVLSDLGLIPALRWLADEMEGTYSLRVAVEDDGLPKSLTAGESVVLFRAVRELLINVAKHAGVQRTMVRALNINGHLVISVEDDGVGIADVQAAFAQVLGFGLASVRERIAFVGGTLELHSAPGKGTLVVLDLPLHQRQMTAT